MKQLQAKLSAGILTAVMILGMVFTMAPMKADAATYQDVLNVLAVDENGTPLVNVELVFEKDGITYDFDTTDANGKISDFNIQDDTDMILDGGYGEYVICLLYTSLWFRFLCTKLRTHLRRQPAWIW